MCAIKPRKVPEAEAIHSSFFKDTFPGRWFRRGGPDVAAAVAVNDEKPPCSSGALFQDHRLWRRREFTGRRRGDGGTQTAVRMVCGRLCYAELAPYWLHA